MTTTRSHPRAPEKLTSHEIDEMMAKIDWKKYWEDVSRRVEKEVDAFEAARLRSLRAGAKLVVM